MKKVACLVMSVIIILSYTNICVYATDFQYNNEVIGLENIEYA